MYLEHIIMENIKLSVYESIVIRVMILDKTDL